MIEVTKTSKISIGLLLTVVPMVIGAVGWYDGRQDAEHERITKAFAASDAELDHEQHASNVELDLSLVNTELKLLRTIEERRELTPDEVDRKSYLEERRRILMAEQRRKANV